MLPINVNRKVSLVLMAVVALFFGYSFQYPSEVVAFPRFLLAVLFLMSILLFIRPGDLGKIKMTGPSRSLTARTRPGSSSSVPSD